MWKLDLVVRCEPLWPETLTGLLQGGCCGGERDNKELEYRLVSFVPCAPVAESRRLMNGLEKFVTAAGLCCPDFMCEEENEYPSAGLRPELGLVGLLAISSDSMSAYE